MPRLTRSHPALLPALGAPLGASAAPTFSQLGLQLGSGCVGAQQQGEAAARIKP